jgi:hypothetical protein
MLDGITNLGNSLLGSIVGMMQSWDQDIVLICFYVVALQVLVKKAIGSGGGDMFGGSSSKLLDIKYPLAVALLLGAGPNLIAGFFGIGEGITV